MRIFSLTNLKQAFLVMLCLLLLPVAAAFGNDQKEGSDFTIATGQRLHLKNKGFSIVPPKDWEVHQQYPGLSLLLQVPFSEGLKYQRTIQIMTFGEPRFIDDVTRREFEQVIIKKYSNISQSISNYRMRNHLITKMEDGSEGILYYSEFALEGKEMMQAHILVSSSTNHYLLTYTDVAEHFQGDAANDHLTRAWEAMTSIKVGAQAPVRFRGAVLMGLGFIGLLILIILLYLLRHAKAGRKYSKDPSGDDDDSDDTRHGKAKASSADTSHSSTGYSAFGNSSAGHSAADHSSAGKKSSPAHSSPAQGSVGHSSVASHTAAPSSMPASSMGSGKLSQVDDNAFGDEASPSQVNGGVFSAINSYFSGFKSAKGKKAGKAEKPAKAAKKEKAAKKAPEDAPESSIDDDEWATAGGSQQKSAINDRTGTSGVSQYNDDDDDQVWK